MIARRALTAFGCQTCRQTIYQAVLRSNAPSLGNLSQNVRRAQTTVATRRFMSTRDENVVSHSQTVQAEKDEHNLEEDAEADEDTPWFLEEEAPRHLPSQHKPTLPKIPENAPEMLEPLIKYVYEDMGLDDLSLLDLRDIDPPTSLGPNLVMLFGTARSERHLHISSGRFVRWIRRNYNVSARAEGLIGAGELKTKLRRLRKKAKLLGQNTLLTPGADLGISTGWVCVNTRTAAETVTDESANFDASGLISGFGASEHGTTIVVQCMTESRRQELDLESLWKGILKRNLKEQAKIRGEKPSDDELDGLVATKLQLHQAPGASQWSAMEKASQQHRYYSTSARRLAPSPQVDAASDNATSAGRPMDLDQVASLQQEFLDIQLAGAPMDEARLEQLVSSILRAPLSGGLTVEDRLALVDQMLHTGDERGLKIHTRQMLVTIIEALVTSPAYGPELGRAQVNFEMLLRELDTPPTEEEVARLMNAYASHGDWERFWEIFKTTSRFQLPRSGRLYELAFRTIAATQDVKLCQETLRWLYYELIVEQPSITPDGALGKAIVSCVNVADKHAMRLHKNPPNFEAMPPVEVRRIQHNEYVKILASMEALCRDGPVSSTP
ncbi:ATPase synthesis protein 25, mitochondrial [Emericellopsis atlantica]|uniref:ATPase synthesis protein 25 n=1 Tax=Emericellopsis atlantica TaxID=2614577 RepID=A0A9P7ZIC1_9HYPO|nr:ATPase synthesis protein 25, mitochondrial [Emericellopsis atlantica]KAG9252649.1 ATPase synthesis protein 25, mitochondrial [Emericellopsis atlantica]